VLSKIPAILSATLTVSFAACGGSDTRPIGQPVTTDPPEDGQTSAWARGLSFPGDDGSMYLTYVVRDAAPPSLAGKYATYAQAVWAAAPGRNPATSYLMLGFTGSFPGGLIVGSPLGNTARFLDIPSIDAFLPESGTPAALTQSYVNPPNPANPFAGEVLALTLKVAFDATHTSAGRIPLSSLLVADPASSLYGLTVGDVLTNANLLLAGTEAASKAMLPDTYDAVVRINANFENGTADLGFLGLP
jgi:hypothetical protein